LKSKSSSLWRGVSRWLPGVIISLIALYFVFRLASWNDLRIALATFKIEYLPVAICITLVWLLCRAFAWRTLLGGKATVWQTYKAINIGYLLNNLFPFRMGEFGRAVVLGQSTQLGFMRVFSTVILERAFDLVYAAILLLSTLPLALGMDWAKPVAAMTLLVVVAGLVVLFLMALNQEKVENLVSRWGKKSKLIEKYILPQINSLLSGLKVLTQPSQFLISLFWIGMSWLLGVMLYYYMLGLIADHIPFWWGIFTDSILAMGIAIPSAPSSLGVFEAAIVGGLGLLGIDPSAALAYAIIMHFLQIVITGVLGVYGLLSERVSLRNLFSEIRLRKNVE
jgi:glycosyltransferase 2 family protein